MTPPQGMVAPGQAIGILGGGQLGRMLAVAAAQLGIDVHVLDPDPAAPAARVAARHIVAAYDDVAALAEFGEPLQIATFEFENVPVSAVEHLARCGVTVRPGAEALSVTQDRKVEKEFLGEIGVPVAPWHPVDDPASANAAQSELGGDVVLKSRRMGYDGKGQRAMASADDAAAAYEDIGSVPCVMEQKVDFIREFSVIACRGVDGATVSFDAAENRHREGILRESIVPAGIVAAAAAAGRAAAVQILDRLQYVGVLAVEFFELSDGEVLVNEMAPRVHNSGHWTLDASDLSQFEAHVRAVAGWPLPNPRRTHAARMLNLIGEEALEWRDWASRADAHVHLYGKRDVRPGRKMGHVTLLTD